MKKYCLLSAVLALSLTGCTVPGVGDVTIGSDSSEEASSEEVDYSKDAVPAEPFDSTNLPIYKIYTNYDSVSYHGDKELPKGYTGPRPYEIYYQRNSEITMADEYKDDYPELYNTLMEKAKEHKEDYSNEKEKMSEGASEQFEFYLDSGDVSDFQEYCSSNYLTVARSDDSILSIKDFTYLNMGGGHGQYAEGGYTYDVKTGKELTLSDVVTASDTEFRKAVSEELINLMGSDYYWIRPLDEMLGEYYVAPDAGQFTYEWFMDYEGINILFNPYELGSYGEGIFEVKLRYDKYEDILNGAYTIDVPANYITCMDVNFGEIAYATVGEDYYFTYDGSDKEYATNLTLSYKGQRVETDLGFENIPYAVKCYKVVPGNGKEYLYVELPGMTSYYDIAIFDITGDSISYVDRISCAPGGIDYVRDYKEDYSGNAALTYTDRLLLGMAGYGFGTYSYNPEFKVGDDGMPVQLTEDGIVGWGTYDAKSLKDLNLDVVDEDGNVVSEKELIPAGTSFDLVKANDGTVAICRIDDGRLVKIELDEEHNVDGTPVTELFSDIVIGDF